MYTLPIQSRLDSGSSPMMHVLESVCRDAMLRHNPDKIEDLNSTQEDEEEEEEDEDATDSDVVMESSPNKENVLNRSAQPPITADTVAPSDVVAKEDIVKSACVTTVEPAKVAEDVIGTESVTGKVLLAGDRESNSPAATVKVSKERRISVSVDKVVPVEDVVIEEQAKKKSELVLDSRVSAESKDCDKPKSGANGEVVKGEGKVPPTDDIMDLDSQESSGETEGLKDASELPKESEKGANVSDTVKIESVDQTPTIVDKLESIKDTLTSTPTATAKPELIKEASLPQPQSEDNNKTNSKSAEGSVSAVPSGEDKSKNETTENVLKRKRPESPTAEVVVPSDSESTKQKEEIKATEDPSNKTLPTTVTAPEDTSSAEPPSSKRTKLCESATELLQRELVANFGRHDRLLREYITKSAAESSEGGIQKHVDQLVLEIEALNDMIRTKELEWNNMVHLKKVKEELVMRLTRKKHVMDILAAPLDKTVAVAQASVVAPEVVAGSVFGGSQAISKAAVQANKLIQNLQLSSSLSGAAATSKTTQNILQNRANMTTEDLEKEKKNTAKLHR